MFLAPHHLWKRVHVGQDWQGDVVQGWQDPLMVREEESDKH